MSCDLVRVPVSALFPWNPFSNSVWASCDNPITQQEVAKAIEDGRLQRDYVLEHLRLKGLSREWEIERVAFLVVHGWDDAICIDVGIPHLGCHVDWPITDGHHRLAAAIYRGDSHILASLAGCIDTMIEMGLCTEEDFS